MKNLFLISERGCEAGDRLLKEIIKEVDCTIGGYIVKITKDPENYNVRIFDLTSLYDGEEGNIFFRKDDSLCLSKLNKEVFDSKGVEILAKSFKERDLIVMDEIGFLESKADKFTREIFRILDSSKAVFGVIKEKKCEYISNIWSRQDIIILKVTWDNFDEIREAAIDILKKWDIPFK